MSSNDQNWANFGNFIGGIVSSVFSFASFIILITNFIFDRDKIAKDRCIEYLKHVNILNAEFNQIIMNIENIRHYSKQLMGDDYNKIPIIINNEYMDICSRINDLKQTLIDNEELYLNHNTSKMYYDLILKNINDVINPNLFINIFSKFENNACNYFYLIDRKLRNEYKEIIKTIEAKSRNNMNDFNIHIFKKKIVQHIYSINENIVEKNLDRTKDLFDN